MPTAAKLMAAFAFALVGYFGAEAVKPALPEGTQFGLFSQICAGIGLLCGWIVMAGLTGKGYVQAASSGIRVSVTIVFWALLGFSTYQMMLLSMKMRYDGPMDAVLGVFDLMMGYGKVMGTLPILLTLIVGGMVAGMATEWAGRRWK